MLEALFAECYPDNETWEQDHKPEKVVKPSPKIAQLWSQNGHNGKEQISSSEQSAYVDKRPPLHMPQTAHLCLKMAQFRFLDVVTKRHGTVESASEQGGVTVYTLKLHAHSLPCQLLGPLKGRKSFSQGAGGGPTVKVLEEETVKRKSNQLREESTDFLLNYC
jgi:hypothetical protein